MIYSLLARSKQSVLIFAVVALAIILISSKVSGQAQTSVLPGVVKVKVTEEMGNKLETSKFTRSASGQLQTGISKLDEVNNALRTSSIKRLFPEAGKFEAKHRKYGLHLWYEIEIDKAVEITRAIPHFKSIDGIHYVEPVYTKERIGSSRPGYGPVVAPNLTPLSNGSNDPRFSDQWHYHNTGQTGGRVGADIKLLDAWRIETGKSNVVVSVHDGGIDFSHDDIRANRWINSAEVAGNGIDDDNNGYIDDVNGYNFADRTSTIPADNHGTHVGGTIAAVTNNGKGVAGVAGGSGSGDGVRLMSCAVFGYWTAGGFEQSYVYAADNGAVISQNSWGYTSMGYYEQSVLDAIDYFVAEAGTDSNGNQTGPMKGGIVIFAAGNDGYEGNSYPGYYSPVLAVASTNHNDQLSWYSTYGTWVDISAPGGETNVNNQGVLSTLPNNSYGYFQGTSMACPHVSGVAALVVSKYGGNGFTPSILRTRLQQTSDNITNLNPSYSGKMGAGRVNALNALLQDDQSPPTTITNLAVESKGITTITLTWTAPSDGTMPMATVYDLRYSTSAITSQNFNSATRVTGVSYPKLAGQTETHTVTNLAAGTTYYFAIKSADFFGNTSGISNILQTSTNLPPVISVSQPQINTNLKTAESTSKSLTIYNSGQGPLNFTITPTEGATAFAQLSINEGVVSANQSRTISASISAKGLLAGTYYQYFTINSDDPVTPALTLTFKLTVTNNGTPIANISSTSLNFGNVFVGATKSLLISITNDGSENLNITSVASTNNQFSATPTALVITPFATKTIEARYTPSSYSTVTGTLTISSNDPVASAIAVAVSGTGTTPPQMLVDPSSITASARRTQQITKTISIKNSGGHDLNYKLAVRRSNQSTITKSVTIMSRRANAQLDVKPFPHKVSSGYARTSKEVTIKSVFTSSSKAKVLVLSPDYYVGDLVQILNSFDDIEAESYTYYSSGLSLDMLRNYNVVITTNYYEWRNYGTDADQIGNLLADYIDQGGKVIVHQLAMLDYYNYGIKGRFKSGGYSPVLPSPYYSYEQLSLMDVPIPDHPIMQGVTSVINHDISTTNELSAGAQSLATWSNGSHFVALKNNVLSVNIMPSSGYDGYYYWEGDYPTLIQNAIHYFAIPSFVKIDLPDGTVSPGQTKLIDIRLDANGLKPDTYEGMLEVSSNAVQNAVVNVPITFTVLGAQLEATPATLDVTVHLGEEAKRTLRVTNKSNDDLSVSVFTRQSQNSTQQVSPTTSDDAVNHFQQQFEKLRALPRKNGTPIKEKISLQRKASNEMFYNTSFEDFGVGNVNGQSGWYGFGSTNVSLTNPRTGSKNLRISGLSYDWSYAVSPEIIAPKGEVTTVSLDVSATGYAYQKEIGFLTSEGWINTAIYFDENGKLSILVRQDGNDYYQNTDIQVPQHYFNLKVESEKNTRQFSVYIDNTLVFQGVGLSDHVGSMYVVDFSSNESSITDVDNINIYESNTFEGDFILYPVSEATIPAGSYIDLEVVLKSEDLQFGKYLSNIALFDGFDEITVPVTLTITHAEFAVSPDNINHELWTNQTAKKSFSITNKGPGTYPISLSIENVIRQDVSLTTADKSIAAYEQLLTLNNDVISLSEGASADVDLNINTQGVSWGTYYAIIRVKTYNQVIASIPITLIVYSDQKIELNETSIEIISDFQTITRKYFLISNTGGAMLSYTISAPAVPWLSLHRYQGNIEPSRIHEIEMTANNQSLAPGTYETELTISTNDPQMPSILLPVSLIVKDAPTISVAPDSVVQIMHPNDKKSRNITITNNGGSTLYYEITHSKTPLGLIHRSPQTEPNTTAKGKGEKDLRKGEPVLQGKGGPDVKGYTWIDNSEPGGPTFNWIDISSYGSHLYLGDDSYSEVTLPFSFPFYNSTLSKINVSSNGYLSADPASSYSNEYVPYHGTPNTLIAAFWDDLYPGGSGAIQYHGNAERFIVQYTDIYHISGSSKYTFQIILYPNGQIVFQYLKIDNYHSATIGIENETGSDGLQIAFNNAYPKANLAVKILPPLSHWVIPSPEIGTIAPGQTQTVSLSFNTMNLSFGDYKTVLNIATNANDYVHQLKVDLTVTDNIPPVLKTMVPLTLTELDEHELSLESTDDDDPSVTVRIKNAPSFIKFKTSTDKGVLYTIKPLIGHAGTYQLAVEGVDTRGVKCLGSTTIQVNAKSGLPPVSNDDPFYNEEKLKLYPVPVKERLTISLVSKQTGLSMVRLYNATGLVVYEKSVAPKELEAFRLNTVEIGLSSGVYIVHVTLANGSVHTGKFIKD